MKKKKELELPSIREEPITIEFILGELRINPNVKDTYIFFLLEELEQNAFERGFEEGQNSNYEGYEGWVSSY